MLERESAAWYALANLYALTDTMVCRAGLLGEHCVGPGPLRREVRRYRPSRAYTMRFRRPAYPPL